MLATAYRNLKSHVDKDALGPVNPKLRHLLQQTRSFIVDSYNPVMKNEGAALLKIANDVKSSRLNHITIDANDIKHKVGAAIKKFHGLSVSIVHLRWDADKVIEAARDRKQSLQYDIDSIREDVQSKRKEYSNAKSTLGALEKEISSKQEIADKLDDEASSAKRKARKRKKGGLLKVVVGVVSAPFTMGAGLGVAALGLGDIKSSDEAFSRARELRELANSQKSGLPDLRSKMKECEEEKNEVEKDLNDLQREQREVERFLRVVESVLSDLYKYEQSIDSTVETLRNFKAGLQTIKLQTDSIVILQSIFNKFRVRPLSPTAESLFNRYCREWKPVESFLINNKSLSITI